MGPRGDAIAQVDFVVGEIMKSVEKHGIAANTMLIFTSDNGPVLNDGYEDFSVEKLGNHNPSGPFRGGKYSIYESGTRVPTIVYWKGKIIPLVSNALLSQVDFYSSFAALVGQKVPANVLDSKNHLTSLTGEDKKGRDQLLEEAGTLALRIGDWKYIKPSKYEKHFLWVTTKGIESGIMDKAQLFNLRDDPSEQVNLADKYPEKVKELHKELERIENRGGS